MLRKMFGTALMAYPGDDLSVYSPRLEPPDSTEIPFSLETIIRWAPALGMKGDVLMAKSAL